MLERIGAEEIDEITRYLQTRPQENIHLLNDLLNPRPADYWTDTPFWVGYRLAGRMIAVQAFYRYGRWFPHFEDPIALEILIEDMMSRQVRWILGVRRVVDPLLEQLRPLGISLSYDEHDYLCYVDRVSLRPVAVAGVRRATEQDVAEMAELRCQFEAEYFGVPTQRVDRAWCLRAAQQYVAQGAFVAEHEARIVSMVAVEAAIAGLAQVGAVYTERSYRSRGFAKGVVSAICEALLQHIERVLLTVRTDNLPALRAYEALGFQWWDDYRMARFA